MLNSFEYQRLQDFATTQTNFQLAQCMTLK